MDGNRIYLVSEEIEYEGTLDVHICKNLDEVVTLFERFDISKEDDGDYFNENDKWNFDYLTVRYRDLDELDTVAHLMSDNLLELKERVIIMNHQQSALGAILSAKIGLDSIKEYKVNHNEHGMITDIYVALNTRDQAIINNTHRVVGEHFATNLYGIDINVTKPVE